MSQLRHGVYGGWGLGGVGDWEGVSEGAGGPGLKFNINTLETEWGQKHKNLEIVLFFH